MNYLHVYNYIFIEGVVSWLGGVRHGLSTLNLLPTPLSSHSGNILHIEFLRLVSDYSLLIVGC